MLDSHLHLNQKYKLKNRIKSNQTVFKVHLKFDLIYRYSLTDILGWNGDVTPTDQLFLCRQTGNKARLSGTDGANQAEDLFQQVIFVCVDNQTQFNITFAIW
jgi:hypothetical protein